jgi:ferredoxin-NADP reductase
MGSFGAHLYRLPVGSRLLVIPPRGKFVLDPKATDDLVLCAGGAGVTPYRGFVRYLRAKGLTRPTTLLHSARVPQDLIFEAEFRAHARECPWFEYVRTVTRLDEGAAWDGLRGRLDAEMLRRYVREPAHTSLYACGPDAFVDAALAAAATVGVPPASTHKEKWG